MKKIIQIVAGLCLICFLSVLSPAQAATTYYVDAVSGNDGSDGSIGAPWQSLSRVDAAILSPGDSVLFKRGQTWRGQLFPQNGDASNYITYGAYGVGAKPILLGSVSRNDPSDWTDEGGNIWRAAVKNDLAPTGAELAPNPSFDSNTSNWHLYVDASTGEDASMSRDTAVYDTAPASLRLDCSQHGTSGDNSIQLSIQNVPIVAGQWYSFSFRAKGSESFKIKRMTVVSGSSSATTGMVFSSPTITTSWATYTMYFKASVSGNASIVLFLGNGVLPTTGTGAMYIDTVSVKACTGGEGVIISNIGNLFGNDQSLGFKTSTEAGLTSQGKFWYDADNATIKVYSTSNPATYYAGELELAMNLAIISQNNRSYINYENLHLKYAGAFGINGSDNHHINIRDMDISFIGSSYQSGTTRYGNGIQFWNSSHDIVVERCRIWEVFDAGVTPQGTSAAMVLYNIFVRNNLIWNCHYSIEFWAHDPAATVHDVYFENNTLVNAGQGWGTSVAQRGQLEYPRHFALYNHGPVSSPNIYIRNNIMYESINARDLLCVNTGYVDSSHLTIDYNLYYKATTSPMIQYKGSYYAASQAGFSAYQSASGKDAHSLYIASGTTVFSDIFNYDFHLVAGSPAIDAGTDAGITTDFENNARPAGLGWDIGAYEYGAVCANKAVTISETSNYYDTVSAAYTAASTGQVILMQERSFTENLSLAGDIIVTLKGGYDCNYSSSSGFTTISGKITIGGLGKVTADKLIIK
jgi:hypothetical protein